MVDIIIKSYNGSKSKFEHHISLPCREELLWQQRNGVPLWVLWLEPSPGSHPSKIKVKKKLWVLNDYSGALSLRWPSDDGSDWPKLI